MSRALTVLVLAGAVLGCQPVKSLDGDMFRDPTVAANRQALAGAKGEGPNGAHLLYLNYDGDGTTLYAATGWPEDSRTNKSQIIRSYRGNVSMNMPKANFTPLANKYTAQQAKDKITQMVRDFFAPYNVLVVTTRPTGVKYAMVIVGGSAAGVLGGDGPTGISPLDCDLNGTSTFNPVEQNISFAFLEDLMPQYSTADEILKKTAITIAHEAGHAYGLEHTLNKLDIMYPAVIFGQDDQDTWGGEAQLREYPSSCDGKNTQNTAARLLTALGAGSGMTIPDPMMNPTVPAPVVKIIAPKDGETVPTDFTFYVSATSNGSTIDHVNISANGQDLGDLTTPPFKDEITTGGAAITIELTATAYDKNGKSSSATVTFKTSSNAPAQVIGCAVDGDCTSPQTCDMNTNACTSPSSTGGTTSGTGGTTSGTGGTTGNTSKCPTGCPAGFTCMDNGECAPPANAPMAGQVGAACGVDAPCLNGAICASFNGQNLCTKQCEPADPNSCPGGMRCVPAGGEHFCAPANRSDSGGCSAAPGRNSTGAPLAMMLLLVVIALGVQRRARHSS